MKSFSILPRFTRILPLSHPLLAPFSNTLYMPKRLESLNISNTPALYSSDSPVLWIRLDPEMSLLRSTVISQPDYQWQYQLRHERDVTAQSEAIGEWELDL